jgi:hypothetical protein
MFILKLLLFTFLSYVGFSEEGKKEEATETKKEEKLPPWTEIQNRLAQIDARIKMKMDNLGKLIEEKQKLPANSPRVKEVINQMISEHKELQKLASDYEKEKMIFKFRYPEKSAKAGRKYEPVEVKSLEEMETEMGIDGRLTRNMKKLRGQYGDQDNPRKKTKSTEQIVDKKEEKSIDDSGTIIIKK